MKKEIRGFLVLKAGILLILGVVCLAEPNLGQNRAGFITIEPVTYYFHHNSYFNRLALTSSEARLWYSFHAPDQSDENTPIFVFFNGGPGASASSGLMSMGTSRYCLDNQIDSGGGDGYIANPYSWTRLGYQLYIDPRQTGFSYSQMILYMDVGQRFRDFNAQNFNPYFDGADTIRVLLRLLSTNPSLQRSPIVIVGESYGGVRSNVMLHLLLNYSKYADGSEFYQDPALVQEIQKHFDQVFPEYAGNVVPPEVIARQFGHQVLIQPAVSYGYQLEEQNRMLLGPDSPLFALGEEISTPFDPAQYSDPLDYVDGVAARDYYIYSKPKGWLNGFFNNAGVLLHRIEQLSLITGVDVTAITELYAQSRLSAFRIINPDYSWADGSVPGSTAKRALLLDFAEIEAPFVRQQTGDLSMVFGALQPWDRYFIGLNYNANWAYNYFNVAIVRGYEVSLDHSRTGAMFLKNLAHVHTFITNASYDLVVYSPAIPPSLARHSDILSSVRHVTSGSEPRPGHIELTYRPYVFPDMPWLSMRSIRFPVYDSSCHAVSLTQPRELLADVAAWLKLHGMDNLDWEEEQ